jgi:lipid-A-disaccharide synthase
VTLTVAMSAGERSGDALAADVAAALKRRRPDVELVGVTGPRMRSAGVRTLADVDELSVMGLFEVARHVPRLAALRRRLRRDIVAARADGFVGFDAPDFHLGLARSLRRTGVPTMQVVAPSVWAWRRYRIPKIARSVDRLLTLFPFEPALFLETGPDARFIGHPLADALPMTPDRRAARGELGVEPDETVVALLPGSRGGEIARHAGLVLELAARLAAERRCRMLLLLADAGDIARFASAAGVDPAEFGVDVVVGRTRQGLTAADAAVAASGTVTLEALLCRTPMVVFYRLPAATYRLARALRLVRSRHVSLPNVLAGAELVPERIQHEATCERLLADLRGWLDDARRRDAFAETAAAIHRRLAAGAAEAAAAEILELVGGQTARDRLASERPG